MTISARFRRSEHNGPAAELTRPCTVCEGTGRVPLADSLLEVLRELRRGAATPPELYERLGEEQTTRTFMNNRLEALRALGLVTRRRNGKAWVYSLAETIK